MSGFVQQTIDSRVSLGRYDPIQTTADQLEAHIREITTIIGRRYIRIRRERTVFLLKNTVLDVTDLFDSSIPVPFE
jgi:hypothetical protein